MCVIRSIMVPSLLCIFVAHIIFLHVFFLPPFPSLSLSLCLSLSLSPPSFSLWLQDTCHLMPFTKYPLLNQSYFFTPYPSIAHIKFTNHSIHRLSFTTTILRAAWKTSFSLSGQPSSSSWQPRIVFVKVIHVPWSIIVSKIKRLHEFKRSFVRNNEMSHVWHENNLYPWEPTLLAKQKCHGSDEGQTSW